MRITYRVFLVGCIPIAIAAAIAVAAVLLLNEADRARSGALLAGSIYRNLLAARSARDEFLQSKPVDRPRLYEVFQTHAEQARFDLQRISTVLREAVDKAAAAEAAEGLKNYRGNMLRLNDVTVRNDGMVAEMGERAKSLIALTDKARERQHASNADIIESVRGTDRRLQTARDIVDRAQELGAAVAALELGRARAQASPGAGLGKPEELWRFELSRTRSAAAGLSDALRAADRGDAAAELGQRLARYENSIAPVADAALVPDRGHNLSPGGALTDWAERLMKINAAEQRTLQDEVAELLTYSVQAGETEQATQNIAIETLKLGNRADEALADRAASAADTVLHQSRALSETVAALPISPLIQSEMIDRLDQWRAGLKTTVEGLDDQTRLLSQMDGTAERMIEGARFLDERLTRNAGNMGGIVRNILILGAAAGLLLGGATGIAVARSITEPLKRLQQRMMELAADSRAGPIENFDRRDELGDMARATNVFITEISRRETALRKSRDRADAALTELQKTQTDLIQAEKLASLGQLVAGVAHEINTPLGIALTTSTLLSDEAKLFAEAAASGRLQRSVLERFLQRTREGTQMMFANLTRAADLVHSFKQVAADQASGERRAFEMDEWLGDMITSLSPVLRKTQHEVVLDCPPDIVLDTYPGALGQVLTNLLVNATSHAYGPGQVGRLAIRVSQPRVDLVRIVFSDDGRGIPAEHHGKVFDPFFTTGRSSGNTGLGLHIVYNLVTSRLQGRISLYSRLGKGTRFTIDLPKVLGDPATEASADPQLQLQGA